MTYLRPLLPFVLTLAAAPSAQLDARLQARPQLSLGAASLVAEAAEAAARAAATHVVIAVVDAGGALLVLRRMDDAQVASVEVALGKARTAAVFRRPSAVFEQQIRDGRLASLVLPGATPLQGGVPLFVDGVCIGAVGVSGNTPKQDEDLALAGAAVAPGLVSPRAQPALAPARFTARVRRLDPELDALLPPGVEMERLAAGFAFTEGPLWSDAGQDAGLLFSDPNRNVVHLLTAADVRVFRAASGYAGADVARYRQPGSNGLAFDAERRLTLCEHGNRRVTRLEPDGALTVLAERFEGRRLNSPNDLVYGGDGALYFTDPPFGLPDGARDPGRELPFSGVYRLAPGGELRLLTRALAGPNGIALSPDERTLYVGDWDQGHKVVMRYTLQPDGSIDAGQVLCDLTAAEGDAAIDGVKVDQAGHVWVAGPGGIWVVAADGRLLGRVDAFPEEAHNLAWGDADGCGLYIAAQTGVYRLRVGVRGYRPFAARQ